MAAITEKKERRIDLLFTKLEAGLLLFLAFCNYIRTINIDVLLHA